MGIRLRAQHSYFGIFGTGQATSPTRGFGRTRIKVPSWAFVVTGILETQKGIYYGKVDMRVDLMSNYGCASLRQCCGRP
jgi:hypothetical protein